MVLINLNNVRKKTENYRKQLTGKLNRSLKGMSKQDLNIYIYVYFLLYFNFHNFIVISLILRYKAFLGKGGETQSKPFEEPFQLKF